MTKFLLTLAVVFTALIIGGLRLFRESTTPLYQAKAETTTYVQSHSNITEVNDFYWMNTDEETYYSVSGLNPEVGYQLAIVRQSDGAMEVFNFDDIITEYDAYYQALDEIAPGEILNMRAGFIDEAVPVWEVSFKDEQGQMGYYYIHLETGEWLRTISNL